MGQHIVDILVVSIPLFVLWSLAVGLLTSFASTSADPSSVGSALGGLFMGVIGVLTLLSIAPGWLVMAWWPAKHNGQTPAMRWFNLRIITEDGGQATLGALTVRWLLLIVDGIFGAWSDW